MLASRIRFVGHITRIGRALLARAFESLIVLAVLATLVFLSLRLVPGDPAMLILGDQAGPSELAALRHKLHFDEPLSHQYLRFVRGLATLDLGDSLRRPGIRARDQILEAMVPTSELACLGVALGALAGLGLAVLGAGPWLGRHKHWVERVVTVIAAIPLLAWAPLLTFVLAVQTRIVPLPGDPDAGFAGLLFASSLLAIPLGSQLARIGRAALNEVENSQFLLVAKAKGASSARIWFIHALASVTGPIVAVIATQLGALLGGAVVLETLFERAGLGSLILEAYGSRDLPVLEGAIVAAGVLFVATQSVAAALHAAIDPRAAS